MDIFAVDWIVVVAAALMGFVAGSLWYGPILGKRWQQEAGLSDEDLADVNMPLLFGGAFAFSLLASWTLAHTFLTYQIELSPLVKLETAFGVALGFIVPAIGIIYLFSRKSRALFFIDAGYWLVFFTLMGVVQGYLPGLLA